MGATNDLATEAEARIGSTLCGKWRIERLIAVGGMGAVYEARHRNKSRVAVKVLHRAAVASSSQLARFKREGYAANHVGHPGAVEIFDDDVDEQGVPFLVMELLTGKTVADIAEEQGGRLPVQRVIELADRVLDVLAAAHENGILHRDIKPANLFLTQSGALKVLDFGIARFSIPEHQQAPTLDGTLLGTPAFFPPEQARGRLGEMDARSDLWSVGATLFTLLTGRFVHLAETTNEQLALAMSVGAPSLSSIDPSLPPDVVAVVDRALAYDKTERWPSARAMQGAVRSLIGAGSGEPMSAVEALAAHLVTQGVATLPEESCERTPRARSWRWRLAIVAVPAMGLLAGLRLVSTPPPNIVGPVFTASHHSPHTSSMETPLVSHVVAVEPVAEREPWVIREQRPPVLAATHRVTTSKRTAPVPLPNAAAGARAETLALVSPAEPPTKTPLSNLFDRRH